ncbi:MAG: hypothetical protein A2077_00305 [Nitrospirae bacterium GWC2_46_6]|nr:MAG: hypothetical protein A2077_00305 [Nitrospirae bacterium GWC2_46_6]OGW21394.1 MAG: hypothetical protein A2Z82_05820 [Nitrospirae bacterium GWA2_46_11]OGW23545.1 MAG: hypothetical protein A2X55_02110 [Nitrospirae bacterium GWB2_47_37]HAK88956.1 hypothetical protein [Nitrospiraceae bacterium]HCZ12482.1 hypothetical protein [Nitrospiraceae bacterium]
MREEESEHHRRQHDRRNVLLKAGIIMEGQRYDCSILNISTGGAKVQAVFPAGKGRIVQLEIGDFGLFSGTVVWRTDREMGIEFDHDPAEIAEVIIGLAVYS